jgi:hypothetical protein
VSSLTLTFQLSRIKKEAEKLCAKEGSAVKALAAADKALVEAKEEQVKLQEEKRAATEALSLAFAGMAI